MKPQNLLVFRDLTVKLGDFGISIKLPDNTKDDDLFDLRGMTYYYTDPDIRHRSENNE